MKKQTKYIYLSIIILLTIITFSNSFNNGFVSFDDIAYITTNNFLKDISFNGIKSVFSNFIIGNYHPFTILNYAVIYNFYKLNPVFLSCFQSHASFIKHNSCI